MWIEYLLADFDQKERAFNEAQEEVSDVHPSAPPRRRNTRVIHNEEYPVGANG